MSDITDLVAALGGDTKVPGIWDGRYGVTLTSGKLSSWADARGSSGFGPTGTGVGTTKPTVTSGTVITDGVDNGVAWGISSVFDWSLGRSVIYIGDVQASNGWPVVFADAGVTKFIGFDARTAIQARTPTITLPTARSTTRRMLMQSRSLITPYGGAGIEPHNTQLVTQVFGTVGRGNQYCFDNQTPAVASNWQMYVGTWIGTAQVQNLRAIIVLDHPVTGAEMAIIEDWATTQHGIVPDNAATRLVFFDGNSLMAGYFGTPGVDPPTVVMADAALTTDCDYVAAGLPSVEGVTMNAWMDSRVLPAFQGNYAKKVYVAWEITNDLIGGGATGEQAAENIRLACAKAKATGAVTVAVTCLPRATFTTTMEARRLTANTILRGLPTGIDFVADVAAITNLQNPANTTYFNADGTHLTDAGTTLASTDPTYGIKAAVLLALAGATGPATKVGMLTQPSTPVASGVPHATQPKVAIQDAVGTTVTGDTSTVTASLVVETGGATPIGTLTKAAVAGVADFSANGLGVVSLGGATFHWHFTDGALTAVNSASCTVPPAAPLTTGPFIVLAGITVPVMDGQAVEQVEQGGSSERAQAGNLLSDCPWEKLTWQVTTHYLTITECAAVKAAIVYRAHVTCSGLLFGGTVVCEVSWSNGTYITTSTDDGTGLLRSLVLTFRQA